MAKANPSKSEEATLGNKLKHMLGLSSKAKTSAPSSGSRFPVVGLDAAKLHDIGPETVLAQRLKAVKEVAEFVCNRQVDQATRVNIWKSTSDLLKQPSAEARHAAWNLLSCIIRGQYDQLGPLRAVFFDAIMSHTYFEDMQQRLECFQLLSSNGKDLVHFECEVGHFVQHWMKDFLGNAHISDFMALLVNIVKYNAAHLEQDVMTSIVTNTCVIARTATAKLDGGTSIELSLSLLDTIVCYSTIALAALNHVIICLCEVISLEQYYDRTWDLMRKLLGTHLGYTCIVMMCGLLEETANMSDSYSVLLRGAVLFIGMALWGAKRVTTLKNHPSSVLPFFLQVTESHSAIVIYEVTASVQRLVSKYGHEQLHITWDIILDIVEAVLKHIEEQVKCEPELVSKVDSLLTCIETLYQKKQFTGSTQRFFDLVELCAARRPESSVALLIDYRMQYIRQVSGDWQQQLLSLTDKYYRLESRTKVRVTMVDAIWDMVHNERRVSDEEVVDAVVLPVLAAVEEDTDSVVKRRVFQLLIDVATVCPSRFLEIVENLRQTLSQLRAFVNQLAVAPDSAANEKMRQLYTDVQPFTAGFLNLFRTKVQSLPGTYLSVVYDVVTSYLCHHYDSGIPLSLSLGAPLSQEILTLLLDLRVDGSNRLGVVTGGSVVYSCHVIAKEPPSISQTGRVRHLSEGSTATTNRTLVSYADAFHCIRLSVDKEMDWLVLQHVLEVLPMLMQNRSLLMAAQAEDVEKLCQRLCNLISNKGLGVPELLAHRPPSLTKSVFHCSVLPVLASLIPHHMCISKAQQREIIRCLDVGLVMKSAARGCIEALTVAALEMQDVMVRELPHVLLRLSQISANSSMAVTLLEFLSSLVHLPELYTNFVHEQYMSIFAIALPYTNPFKYGHYTVSFAYHVITMWFLKCRLAFRKGFASFIIKGLMMNVKRQVDEVKIYNAQHSPSQESLDRTRAMTMDDTDRLRKRNAAAAARSNLPAVLDESAMNFHLELLETYIDMLARYTFSKCTSNPRRSAVTSFLLEGGQSQRWLVQNKIVTVTTSGAANVGRAGLCEACAGVARRCRTGMRQRAATQSAAMMGDKRKRHVSAVVPRSTFFDEPIVERSSDDLHMYQYQRQTSWSSHDEPDVTMMPSDRTMSNSDENVSEHSSQLETHQQRVQAVDSVLMGLPAKTSNQQAGVFSQQCSCWCTQWAEVHIRRPTGNIAWMMRIENEQDPAELFPEFPFTDISHLFMGEGNTEGRDRIDPLSLDERKYEHLLDEYFHDESHNKQHKKTEHESVSAATQADKPVKSAIQQADLQKTLNWLTMTEQRQGEASDIADTPLSPTPALTLDTRSVEDTKGTCEDGMAGVTDKPEANTVAARKISSDRDAARDVAVRAGERGNEGVAGEKVRSGDKMVGGQRSDSSRQDRDRPTPSADMHDKKEVSAEVKRSRSNTTSGRPQVAHDSDVGRQSQSVTSVLPKRTGSSKEAAPAGASPSFVLLQLYGSQFSHGDDRPLPLPQTEVVTRAMQTLDHIYPYETHKIGLLYVGPGQATNETAILANRCGSSRYMNFINGLGTLLRLRDCDPEMTYMGGLDRHDNDGAFAYSWHEEFMQVIFHVATLMPNKDTDRNCNAKKLHIGNDDVSIVYNDSGEDYRLSTIKGQFNYVNIIIQPTPYSMNIVTVQSKEDTKISDLIGQPEAKVISDERLPQLVRQMAVHADLASTILRRQLLNPSDPYASNWLERLRAIKRLRSKVLKEQTPAAGTTPATSIVDDFTDFV